MTISRKGRERRVGHYIREWRIYREMTQEELAREAGVTPGLISQLEVGRTNYGQQTLTPIATALGTTPGSLIDVNPIRQQQEWENLGPLAQKTLLDLTRK